MLTLHDAVRRLLLKIHEWLADRTKYVQYPAPARYVARKKPTEPTIGARALHWWRRASGAQRGWVYFAVFWGSVIALSIYGNTLP